MVVVGEVVFSRSFPRAGRASGPPRPRRAAQRYQRVKVQGRDGRAVATTLMGGGRFGFVCSSARPRHGGASCVQVS